ncbi:PAP2 superfamily protein [Natronoarchaeum philippinense]|uniref:PAP2 superfamily protein n=1 Tax=Natronoarchaeum philippinense TaxID=558529 RepID=A0A285P7W5_NATPI|nr:phosphatase PAP2 family protein [Natronoarchaeum philippinense]SNZ17835.1 PAP2 superfamily protein [Natronoarchaeum philippinense]
MSRGIGAFEAVQSTVPDQLAIFVALATQLADVWFVSVVLAVLYWYADDDIIDRESVAVVAGLALGALALVYALKYTFALPRPPTRLAQPEQYPGALEALYAATGTASGYGFPSGHAVLSTTFYGLLAQRLSILSRRRRYGVAATLVTIVCLSRVVLGVHFLVDVVAGAALGIVYVSSTWELLDRVEHPATAAFGIAAGLGALAVVASGVGFETVALLGVGLAGLGWRLGLRRRDAAASLAS